MEYAYAKELSALSDAVWSTPEPGFREVKSSAAEVKFLKDKGFSVTENVADTFTGYMAQWGSGKPVIAFLGEFDALYGLSQKADVPRQEPIEGQDMGQGCGHHLLGVGSIAAALYLRDIMQAKGLKGTVRVYGCPGEESGSGKAYMARDGVFADCDVALSWHPSSINCVTTGSNQSCIQCWFRFRGVASHAAGSPEKGRSALDACELMNIGVNYLREHMESSERVHYAYSNAGGKSPNVVQDFAEETYLIRSTTNPKCEKLFERVKNIARGAALMTETQLEIRFDEGLSNVVNNFALEDVLDLAFRELGVPEYTDEERAYAAAFKATYPDGMSVKDEPVRDIEKLEKNMRESELCDYYVETKHSDTCSMGSTDVGDVSWVLPTAQISMNCYSYGAGGHSWQWVAQGRSSIAHKGMLHAGLVLARAAQMLLEDPALIEKAKEEFARRMKGDSYKCLIPDGVKPHWF